MKIFRLVLWLIVSSVITVLACANSNEIEEPIKEDPVVADPPTPVPEAVYDETGCLYTSYTNLVMAGYQGWFAAEGDGSDRGWNHYKNNSCGGFAPGCSSIDMWPDMTEYDKKYLTPFKYADGSGAYLYSPYDEESVDLHFKWMKDYGIDGVHMQRFISTIKPSNQKGKRHANKVLESALKAAKKYDRAISVMYDLSGSSSELVAYMEQDWNELVSQFKFFDNVEHPTYLSHKGKPLVTIWGVGFKDRDYSIDDVDKLVDKLKGPSKKVSIMLGLPYYWRTLSNDTENNPALHALIKKVDIIMPWAVGRYNIDSYNQSFVTQDVNWCNVEGVDYVPLVYPGLSWGNLKQDQNIYNHIPRLKGDFMWKQIAGAKAGGAKSLYVAMFDEVDEGTAIFKVMRENEVPLNGDTGYKFIGIEEELQSDYYLWLTGQGANWFHGEGSYDITKPTR